MKDSDLNKHLKRIDSFQNMERFLEIKRLHQNAFSWKRQGRIPLGVHVVNPAHTEGLDYSKVWLSPQVFLKIQLQRLADTLEIGSDVLPVVGIVHVGHAIICSMFGSDLIIPDDHTNSLNDTGPHPSKVYSSIEETDSKNLYTIDVDIMKKLIEFADYYRANLPSWIDLIGPMPLGPFTLAMQLRGYEFLYDLVDNPELSRQFIIKCAKAVVELEKFYRSQVRSEIQKYHTFMGVASSGLRIGDDSICNLSDSMIEEFCSPAYSEINNSYGGSGHVHFCSLPHRRYEHIYETFINMPEVSIISSQFGFEYYERNIKRLRGKLAVESFYGDAYDYVKQQHGSFEKWANEFVPKYKNESGLVLYLNVESVEEGKLVWDTWQKAHLL